LNIKKTRLEAPLRRGVVALLTVLVLSVAFASSATASPAEHVKPSIVLVHGAWADSGSWDAVVQKLQSRGYTVYAPSNPLRGLANDSGAIRDFLNTIPGPIVLVGHSYGGAVITNAALGDSQVKALVYVDGFLPAKGETLESLTAPGSCFAVADPTTVFDFVPFPGAPAGVFDAYVKQSVFPRCFANGLPAAEAQALAATQRPLATNALTDVSGTPAWMTIPSWAVVGTVDRVIPESSQLMMARRADAHITKVRAPHLSMIKAPGVVARVIVRAARATG
jgi:pimeloyl-ACP methyl ester carboxylesterase